MPVSKLLPVVAAALFALVSGCAPVSQPSVSTRLATEAPCDASAFAPFIAGGTGRISGQAFMKTRGGDVKYGAGNEVMLVPAVSCAPRWWGEVGTKWRSRMTYPLGQAFHDARRVKTADGEGRFVFENLAAGDYYVRSFVTWDVPTTYSANTQGGLVGAMFRVREGETTEAILPTIP